METEGPGNGRWHLLVVGYRDHREQLQFQLLLVAQRGQRARSSCSTHTTHTYPDTSCCDYQESMMMYNVYMVQHLAVLQER
jgi:hypothetical protein